MRGTRSRGGHQVKEKKIINLGLSAQEGKGEPETLKSLGKNKMPPKRACPDRDLDTTKNFRGEDNVKAVWARWSNKMGAMGSSLGASEKEMVRVLYIPTGPKCD